MFANNQASNCNFRFWSRYKICLFVMQILGLFFTNSKDRKQKPYALHEQKSLLRRPPYRYGGLRSKPKVDFYAISS